MIERMSLKNLMEELKEMDGKEYALNIIANTIIETVAPNFNAIVTEKEDELTIENNIVHIPSKVIEMIMNDETITKYFICILVNTINKDYIFFNTKNKENLESLIYWNNSIELLDLIINNLIELLREERTNYYYI